MFRFACLFIAVSILFCVSASAQYAGRYTDGKDYAVYFEQTKYGLTIRPVMWTATQLLRNMAMDKFEVVDRASRGADFKRDRTGQVVGVSIRGMDGEGLELRRADGPPLPVELLLAGNARHAVDEYIARDATAKAVDDAEQVLRRLPTKSKTVVAFLQLLAPRFSSDSKFQTLFGLALVNAGDRQRALKQFQLAYKLDPQNERAISALARLNALPKNVPPRWGWGIPFSLSRVFAKPTSDEIARVESGWARRDLNPRDIREEDRLTLRISHYTFEVRIVSHLVHGFRHYGAILIPEEAEARALPVIIESKGVSPTYFPLDLERIAAPRMMGSSADQFIYVVPSFRGEIMTFKGTTFTSEGDRRDALDGATDDALALLNVALKTTRGADPDRICAFGHSRGGNVAMLIGIRDKRIDCVVNWAGPTDWFYAMGTNGWTEQELWGEGLRTRANTQQTGGQNVERFLMRAIEGKASLKDVRLNMIASSPLYFAHRLPPSQHHYGLDDPSVPSRNAYDLLEAFRRHRIATAVSDGRSDPAGARYQMFLYPDQGHDTDRILAPILSREFILRSLR
jgi:hypothetical protein